MVYWQKNFYFFNCLLDGKQFSSNILWIIFLIAVVSVAITGTSIYKKTTKNR